MATSEAKKAMRRNGFVRIQIRRTHEGARSASILGSKNALEVIRDAQTLHRLNTRATVSSNSGARFRTECGSSIHCTTQDQSALHRRSFDFRVPGAGRAFADKPRDG